MTRYTKYSGVFRTEFFFSKLKFKYLFSKNIINCNKTELVQVKLNDNK